MKASKHLEKVIVLSLALMSMHMPALAADYNNTTAGTQTYPVAVNVTDTDTTSTVGGYTTRISTSGSGVISAFQDTVTSTVDIPAASALNYAGVVMTGSSKLTAAKSVTVKGTNGGGNYLGVYSNGNNTLNISGLLDVEITGTNYVVGLQNDGTIAPTLSDVTMNITKTDGTGNAVGIENHNTALQTGNVDITVTNNATGGITYGIDDQNNAITINGNAKLNVTGGTGITSAIYTMKALDVTKDLNFTMDASKNTTGWAYGTNVLNLHVGGDATAVVTGGTQQTYALGAFTGLTVDGNVDVTVTAPSSQDGVDGILIDKNSSGDIIIGKNAKINVTGGTTTTAGVSTPNNVHISGDTDLKVDGTRVTEGTKDTDGILAGKVLTLDGSLTAIVKGGTTPTFGIVGKTGVTIGKTVDLTVDAPNATSNVEGIWGGPVNLQGATKLKVTGGTGSVIGIDTYSAPASHDLTAASNLNVEVHGENSNNYVVGIHGYFGNIVLNGVSSVNTYGGNSYNIGTWAANLTTNAPFTSVTTGKYGTWGVSLTNEGVFNDTADITVTGGTNDTAGLTTENLTTAKKFTVNVDGSSGTNVVGIQTRGRTMTNGPVEVTVTANPAYDSSGIVTTGNYTANDSTKVTLYNGGSGIEVTGSAATGNFKNTTVNVTSGSKGGVGVLADAGADVALEGTTIINAATALEVGTGDSFLAVNELGDGTTQLTGDLVGSGDPADSLMDVVLDTGDSFLTGKVTKNNQDINLTLSNGAVWNVTGTSTLSYLENNATVNMRYTGNSNYETITTDEISGNGTYVMNTDLQASYASKNVQSSGDKLIITKSSAGNNTLQLRDASLDTKIASQGYLLLVEDQSNGSATFTGTDLNRGGIFRYKPVIVTDNPTDYSGFNASAKNWYLTGFEKMIEVSDNTKATLGLGETRYAGYLMDNDTLLKRLGELRTLKGEPETNGIWARYRHGGMDGDSFSGGFTTVQVGYDKKTSNKRYTGIAFNHTNSSYDFAAGDGEGSQDALAVYNTWLGDKNHYFDIVGKIGKMRGYSTYVDSLYPEKGNYDNWFASISGEYGRKNINDKNGWYYEPQVQLTLGRIRGADYTTSRGTKVELGSITSLIGRAGVTVGKEYNMSNPDKHSNIYAKLNWLHEFKGDAKMSLRDTYGDSYDTTKDYGGSWWNAGIGATINVNKNTHMYLDFEKNFGGEVTTNWIGQVGCQWTWK